MADKTKAEILVGFIPGEVLTAYLAVGAAIAATTSVEQPKLTLRWAMFAVFGLLTPVAGYALWRAKVPSSPTRRRAPWLEMAAATVAFVVWGISLPGSPLISWRLYDPAYPVIAVIIGGLVLSLVTPFAQRPANSRARRARSAKPKPDAARGSRTQPAAGNPAGAASHGAHPFAAASGKSAAEEVPHIGPPD
jgi:hypothetical protein